MVTILSCRLQHRAHLDRSRKFEVSASFIQIKSFAFNTLKMSFEKKVNNKMDELQLSRRIGEILNGIETLVQGPKESFEKYSKRAKKLFYWIHELPVGGKSFAEAGLRLHYLAGLRNKDLKFQGVCLKGTPFPELVECLQEGIYIDKIASRLRASRSQQSTNLFIKNQENEFNQSHEFYPHRNKRANNFDKHDDSWQQKGNYFHGNDFYKNNNFTGTQQILSEHQRNYGNNGRRVYVRHELCEEYTPRGPNYNGNNFQGYNYNNGNNNNYRNYNRNRNYEENSNRNKVGYRSNNNDNGYYRDNNNVLQRQRKY